MVEAVNDNDIAPVVFTKSSNDNDIERATRAEAIAQALVEKFKSPGSFKFYCQVAYALPENRIWHNWEISLKGTNPPGLFNFLCRRDMR